MCVVNYGGPRILLKRLRKKCQSSTILLIRLEVSFYKQILSSSGQ